jgi:hypothetical protein
MVSHKTFGRRIASPALIVVASLVGACGGGGGGTPAPSGPTAAQNCKATASTAGVGYTIGACVLSVTDANNVVTETTTSQLQDVIVSVSVDQNPPAVADPNTGKNYALSVGVTPSGPASGATLGPTPTFCGSNVLGDRTGHITESYSDPTNPAVSPRFTLLSFAKGSLIVDPNAPDKNAILNQLCIPNPKSLEQIGTVLRVSDFGTWERAAGGADIYYGGWYATRLSTNSVPATAKTFTQGSSVGYRFTQSLIYGVSAKVLSGATWDGSTMTLKIDLYEYSRTKIGGSKTVPPTPSWPTITLTSTKIEGAKISGTVSGGSIGGTWEGTFAGAGEELVGRIRFTDTSVDHKFVGAFALK